jgi:uncharacterized protein DUF6962
MSEPTTVLTDYVLALVALGVAWRLARSNPRPSVPGRLWGASFAALGVAAVVGGTWHGIPPDVLPALRYLLWSITYVAIGVADLLILAGAARAALTPWTSGAVLALLTARFLAYAGLVVGRREFRLVAVEFGVTVVLLLAFALDLARRREPAAAFVVGGALLSFAGGLVLALGVRPHRRFNDNDLFHVIQTGGVWLFFQAALLLRSRLDDTLPGGAISNAEVQPGKAMARAGGAEG